MRGWQRTKAARGPGGGSGSQRQVVARDHGIRLAHPEYLDQLARALNPDEVGSVVDDLSGKRLGEPGDALELLEGAVLRLALVTRVPVAVLAKGTRICS